jgi:hypothetical protein
MGQGESNFDAQRQQPQKIVEAAANYRRGLSRSG